MSIEEIQEEARLLDKNISKLINDFQRTTRTIVGDVTVQQFYVNVDAFPAKADAHISLVTEVSEPVIKIY